MKRTKIIATIGPATRTPETIEALYKQWVNVIRMNFSHKDHANMERVIEIVRELNAQKKTKLSLLLDNKWPEIRTGKKEEKTAYKKWDLFKVFIDEALIWPDDIFCDYPYLLEDMQVGDMLRIDSGLFDWEIVSIHETHCVCKAMNDALIGTYRHINLPGKKLRLPGITPYDEEDMLFAIRHKIQIIAMSFVRSAQHIRDLRAFLQQNGWWGEHIIAKIENQEWIDNLEEIVIASDGIMVARGDLGIEVPVTMLPYYTEQIIALCHKYGKPVIVATQMIESMMKEPFPTRAEINDIYQAVQMGADATMLSGETAIGAYPLEAVGFMKKTILTAESLGNHRMAAFDDTLQDVWGKLYQHLLQSSLLLAQQIDAACIVLFTKTGAWAKFLSAYKSQTPILAFTWDLTVIDKLWYYYGIAVRGIEGKPTVNYERITSQLGYVRNPDAKPYVLISDTDMIAWWYPTIQVIK
jgi:pyruvate kinase